MLACVYVLLDIPSGRSYETIIAYFSATGAIFNIMTIYSIFIFRKRYPDAPRPYRAWLYPTSIVIVLLLLVAYLLVTLITAFIPSLAGLLLTMTGLIYYFRKRGKHD